jgi:hypothetical protein
MKYLFVIILFISPYAHAYGRHPTSEQATGCAHDEKLVTIDFPEQRNTPHGCIKICAKRYQVFNKIYGRCEILLCPLGHYISTKKRYPECVKINNWSIKDYFKQTCEIKP